MKHALREGSASLAAFLGPKTLIAVDYDGTLAPIAERPGNAPMRAKTRELLTRVCHRYPVVVLTGRARVDVLRLLCGLPVLEVIGSHGAEIPGASFARYAQRVANWRLELARHLNDLAGLEIEDKRYSLSVHYRNTADPIATRQRIQELCERMPGARICGGKKVFNLIPSEAPNKGEALLAVRRRLGCDRALFAGDDETDEDVFRLQPGDRIFSVRIGRSRASAAEHFLDNQAEMDDFLGAVSQVVPKACPPRRSAFAATGEQRESGRYQPPA